MYKTELNILLGVSGYDTDNLEFHFANVIFKTGSDIKNMLTNVSFNSFKPLLYNNELVSERMYSYTKDLKDKERLEYLELLDCRPSSLVERLCDTYDFENGAEGIELFDNPLFKEFITVPDGDGGYFNILFEEQGRTNSIPKLDELFVLSDLVNLINNFRINMNILYLNNYSDFIEISSDEFAAFNSLIEKNEKYLEENCYHALFDWLLDNSDILNDLVIS